LFFQVETSSKYYRCITIDLPGHGSRINDILNKETAVEAIYEVLNIVAPNKKVLLFGYSLGGYVSMLFAKQYPHLLSGVIYGGCLNEQSKAVELLFGAIGFFYNIIPDSLLWKIVLESAPHIPKHDLDITVLKSGLTHQSWPDCKELVKEPYEGFYVECISTFEGKTLFFSGEQDTMNSSQKFLESAKD